MMLLKEYLDELKKEETLWAVKRIEAIFEIGFRLFVLHSDLIK